MLPRILVVDDDVELNRLIVATLEARRFEARGVGTISHARSLLDSGCWDAAVVDVKLPDGEGIELLADARRCRPAVPVLVMTAFASIEGAVEAMRRGAAGYLVKPFADDEITSRLERLLGAQTLPDESRGTYGFDRIIGRSPGMLDAVESARRVARSDATTVLITGESGTGKDLLARAIHEESKRELSPFMNLTCTAIAEPLFESELFGHEKGAFTGAQITKRGLLEIADGGTVFLDEVGDLPPGLQAKLLRFLQDKSFKRVGGGRDITVDDIELPPLRTRGEDLVLLANAFLGKLGGSLGSDVKGFTPEAIDCMRRYSWPGNVRELRNVIERALILGRGSLIDRKDLPGEVATAAPAPLTVLAPTRGPGVGGAVIPLPEAGLDLEKLERDLLFAALARAKGNKTAAARLLGLNRDQVRYRLKKLRGETGAPPAA